MSADLRATLASLLEQHPQLTWSGYWTRSDDWTKTHEQYKAAREETIGEYGLAQFQRAMQFLQIAPRSRSVNYNRTAYAWKHVAERWHKVNDTYSDYYVGTGSFILACHAAGVMVKKREHVSYVSLSESAASMPTRLAI
jgi:hypothetical protein